MTSTLVSLHDVVSKCVVCDFFFMNFIKFGQEYYSEWHRPTLIDANCIAKISLLMILDCPCIPRAFMAARNKQASSCGEVLIPTGPWVMFGTSMALRGPL